MTRTTALHAAKIAVRAMLIAAIGLTLFVAYGLLNNAWYHVLAVQGGSMEPTIGTGDLIVITRPPERVEAGQVLTLEVDGAVVTHRVVEVRPDGSFVTQGDANERRDDFSTNEVRIIGEFRFSLPLVGSLVEMITSGAWYADAAEADVTTASGSWESAEDFQVFVWSGEGITWVPVEPVPEAEPEATASPTEASETGDGLPEPSPTAEANGETATPSATGAPSPTATSSATEAPTSSEPTVSPEPTVSAEPTPTSTPSPEPTAAPSSEPTPGDEAIESSEPTEAPSP